MAKKDERYEEEIEEMEEMEEKDEIEEKESAMVKFGEHLQEKRKEKFRTQGDFAKLLPMPLSSYSQYEQGKRWPQSIVTLKRMASILDTSIDYLINGHDSAADTYLGYVRGFIKDNIRPNEILETNIDKDVDCVINTPRGDIEIPYSHYEHLIEKADFNFRKTLKEQIREEIDSRRAELAGENETSSFEIEILCEHLGYDINVIKDLVFWQFKGEPYRNHDLAFIIYNLYFFGLHTDEYEHDLYSNLRWYMAQAHAEIYGYDMEDNYWLNKENGYSHPFDEIGLPPRDWEGRSKIFGREPLDKEIDKYIKIGLYNYWELSEDNQKWLENTSLPRVNFSTLFFLNGLAKIPPKNMPLKDNKRVKYLLRD
ncbi:helix-turn-helix domain-containing protein [Anaerovibrio sp. RM50]|uniref:helix-turn-helix domain-containing protein n=1 Tax=Anaerovibrio sp. RM50 TaxID=1200557 RepID=UPI00055BB2E4|nr:helix-turn-helix transcriptional regulator [Anaerovibrio sp. RM50]